jgi:hypothetical protein
MMPSLLEMLVDHSLPKSMSGYNFANYRKRKKSGRTSILAVQITRRSLEAATKENDKDAKGSEKSVSDADLH